MPVELTMPQLGLTMTEGAISRWYKQVGDPIKRGEPILEVVTDKISYEVEAIADGFLAQIRVDTDQIVPVGALLGVVVEHLGEQFPQDSVAPAPEIRTLPVVPAQPDSVTTPDQGGSATQTRLPVSPKARRLANERDVDLSLVTGTGPGGRIRSKDLPAEGSIASAQAPHAPVSPLAARVAEGLGIALHKVQGTGLGGKIMEGDVRRAAALAEEVNVAPAARVAPRSAPAPVSGAPVRATIALPEVKKRMAQRMAQAKREIPHFYESVVIDATAIAKRKAADTPRLAAAGLRLTYTALLADALAQALTSFPLLTARWENGTVVEDAHVHLGIATAIGDGLIVPVIHDANLLSLAGIASELQRLAAEAAARAFDLHDLEGGTFTVSNLGMYKIDSFWPIINPPQCAILGIGAIEDSLLVRNGAIHIAPVLKMVLAADHRIVDGVYAARFLSHLRELLEGA